MPATRSTPAFGDLLGSTELGLVVVLVEPSDPRNIGAVARAMSNLGVSELRLVNAAEFDLDLARGVACWGRDLVTSSVRYESLAAAVADAHHVVGFASDSASHGVPQLLLEEWASSIDCSGSPRIALVFGSEENGLRREHFPLCQFLIRIPSAGDNPSYNLAQSVLLALYTLRSRSGMCVGSEQPEWAVSGQLEGLTEMVLRVATKSGFLNSHSPAHIQDLLINLTRRGRVNARELKILTGLVGMIDRKLG
ncbi:MAG: RNA methyltransferase [Pseudomonadota bacterium]